MRVRQSLTMSARLLSIALFILLLLLLYGLLFGKQNVLDLMGQRARLAQLTEEIKVLRERNERIRIDVNDIKTRLGAIEGLARSELGLIKPGETFYQIVTE
jgi:cell division protein FtsB